MTMWATIILQKDVFDKKKTCGENKPRENKFICF